MRECLVLTPGIFALAQHLRDGLSFLKEPCEIHVTESLTGFDLALRSPQKASPALAMEMAKAVDGLNVARVIFNSQLLVETAVPQVEEGGVPVKLPPQAFLQSTREGEAALQDYVLKIVGKAKRWPTCFPAWAPSPCHWRKRQKSMP
jgi:23S rRNA (uracil1939-C5)-methyltransferase